MTEVKKDVETRVPGIVLKDDSAGALIYTIPMQSAEYISGFVEYLESASNRTRRFYDKGRMLTHVVAARIREWGFSQTTLEEVFLQLIRSVNSTQITARDK